MDRKYCVYEHVFPNGKRYVGITGTDPVKRWRKDGSGYKNQKLMAMAIQKYGWENIKHNVIIDELTKEQAETLEKFLIAEFHTIDNGYNTSTGGENVVAYYLDEYVLKMIWYVNKYFNKHLVYPIVFNSGEKLGIVELCEEGRTDKNIAEYWNEASRAVTHKHREYSTTADYEVLSYWFHMREYYALSLKMWKDEDVSSWEESTCCLERMIIND